MDDDGALAEAYENDAAAKAAIDAIFEEEGLTDALLDDLSTAFENDEIAAAFDAVAIQLNIIADEAFGEIIAAVDDMMGNKIPALNAEIKDQMPGSVGDFVDATWSESNDFIKKINDSDAVSNPRAAIQEQLQ